MVFALKKSKFNYRRLRILGHIITKSGRHPDPEKVQAIIDLNMPKTVKDCQKFVGMVTYNQHYIPNAQHLLAPLHTLMSAPGKFSANWKDDVHGVAINKIKALLTSAPVMQLPDFNEPFRIHVDGCTDSFGCGAVLLQRDPRHKAWLI